MNRFVLYKMLTTCEKDNGINLLESLDYYKNGIIFMDILESFSESEIDYIIKKSFHGSLFTTQNKFEKITVTLNDSDKDKLDEILVNFKDYVKYNLKGNDLTILII